MTSVPAAELDAARATLSRAVRDAGALQLGGSASIEVQAKGAQANGEVDILTNVDRQCEDAVVDLIRKAHPTHPILAEEGTGERVEEGPLWILDPLDGTKNYVHGLPRFACALAFAWDGVALLGAVYNPVLDELFVAESRRGATLNGAAIRVSKTVKLESALVASAFTVRRRFVPRQFERLERLVRSTQGLRVGGCASLDLCDVARGRVDAYFEEGLDPWDTAAGALVVREAGGTVTDFRGEPHQPFGAEMLASNGPIGEAVVEQLRTLEGPE
jgi:myo-inositol-1(or 4)-monophosphatase